MKQVKVIFSILILFLIFFNTSLIAQNIQQVTPSTATRSAEEIKSLFGDKIRVSESEILEFYLNHWTLEQAYSENCRTPKTKMTSISDDKVGFDWDDALLAGEGQYIVSYIRLSTGAIDRVVTQESNVDLEIPNDLYLFAFQSQCSGNRSALDIIIIEKPLDFVNKNCDCPRYSLVWTALFTDAFPLVAVDWNTTNTSESYFVEVDIDDGPYASFRANILFGPIGPQIVGLSPECMKNVKLNADGSFLYMHEPDDDLIDLGVFGFFHNSSFLGGNPQFSFNFSGTAAATYDSGQIYLHKCDRLKRSENGLSDNFTSGSIEAIGLRSLINPFQNQTSIEYALPVAERVNMVLLDAFGRQVQVLKANAWTDAGTHQLAIDLTNQANGMYLCVLQTETETLSLKLLKTK